MDVLKQEKASHHTQGETQMKLTLLALVAASVATSLPVQAQNCMAMNPNCQSSIVNEWSPTIPQVQSNTPDYMNAPLVVIPAPTPYEPIDITPTMESRFVPGQFPVYQAPVYENPYFTPKPIEVESNVNTCSYCGL